MLRALWLSCHPLPCAAVTLIGALMAVAAGNSAGTCVLLAAAVLAGQLVVGWSNDRIDVERDRRVGHPGKPLARGEVPLRLVDACIAVAAVATVVLSLLLGWRSGGLHLAAGVFAFAYNAVLKRTWLSWLPYAAAFAAIPAVATYALPAHPAPLIWLVGVGALLGTAVNFANAVPALAEQPGSDVAGLPDRLGGSASLIVAALLLAAAMGVIVAAHSTPGTWVVAGVVALGLAGGVPALWPYVRTRAPFYAMLLLVPVEIGTVLVVARPLH